MKKTLLIILIASLIITLPTTFMAIVIQWEPKNDLLELTSLLLGWQIIAAGLAMGMVHAFGNEIKNILKRMGSKNPDVLSGG